MPWGSPAPPTVARRPLLFTPRYYISLNPAARRRARLGWTPTIRQARWPSIVFSDSRPSILQFENPYHLVLPKPPKPSPRQWFHIGLPKICSRKGVPKGTRFQNRPTKKSPCHFAGEEQSSALTFIGCAGHAPASPKKPPMRPQPCPGWGRFFLARPLSTTKIASVQNGTAPAGEI